MKSATTQEQQMNTMSNADLLDLYVRLGSQSNDLYCKGLDTGEIERQMDRVLEQLAERGLA